MELLTKILVPLITCFLLVFLALALFIMLNRDRGPVLNRHTAGDEQSGMQARTACCIQPAEKITSLLF